MNCYLLGINNLEPFDIFEFGSHVLVYRISLVGKECSRKIIATLERSVGDLKGHPRTISLKHLLLHCNAMVYLPPPIW